MLAAIDAGSNTLRLLVGRVVEDKVVPEYYLRRISRLAGGFSQKEGLSVEARKRTLLALEEFAGICQRAEIEQVRAIGTAAFRQAVNGVAYCHAVRAATGLPLDIISGEQEAAYMVRGVLSALDPIPTPALIVDIGGGSTEFVLCAAKEVLWSHSLPLGVVRLTEEYPLRVARQAAIDEMLGSLASELACACQAAGLDFSLLSLVGTAGTFTTLAALDMQMTEYDWRKVNNYSLTLARMYHWQNVLLPLTPVERETLPGMEPGRGDLIVAGLEVVLSLLQATDLDTLAVSDFGILEGLLLSLQNPEDSLSFR